MLNTLSWYSRRLRPKHRWYCGLAMVVALTCGSSAYPQTLGVGPETGQPLPRFASLRFKKANLRRGAGEEYPIAWQYMRKGLPVEIIQEFKNWRHIRDHEGETGWMHKSQLSNARTGVIKDAITTLHAKPENASQSIARIEPDVIVTLTRCSTTWCNAKVSGYQGWIQRTSLWGVVAGDALEQD